MGVMEVDDAELRKLAATLVVFGFEGDGETPNEHAKRMIKRGCVSSILFGRNVRKPEQVKKLCSSLKVEAQPNKLLIMTDQEGGRVARLKENFTEIPSARAIASCSNTPAVAVTRMAKVMASELKAVHIDMDLAPVVDVDSNPKNPVIGDRAYSSDFKKVGELGRAFVTSMQAEGIAACAKHFPGHGDTIQDSHHDMPVIHHSRDRLLQVEIAPFREAVVGGVASVIVGHLMVPALQSEEETKQGIPASMSKSIVEILKTDLGFEGAVLIDDIEMGAVTKNFSLTEAVTKSLQAGIDLFLVCHTEESQVKVIDAIFDAVKSGAVSPERFEDAIDRVRRLVSKYASPALTDNSVKLSIVGSKAHRQVIKAILENAAMHDYDTKERK